MVDIQDEIGVVVLSFIAHYYSTRSLWGSFKTIAILRGKLSSSPSPINFNCMGEINTYS